MTICHDKNESSRFNTFWVISPLMLFYAYLCPLCNLNTLWNIIMILHSHVEQVMTMCHVQEWQLLLSYFLSYFPLIVSDAISCPLHNLKTLWYIIIILYSDVKQVLKMCHVVTYKNSNSRLDTSDAISYSLHNLKTFWYMIMILNSYVEQVLTMCPVQEWQLFSRLLCS